MCAAGSATHSGMLYLDLVVMRFFVCASFLVSNTKKCTVNIKQLLYLSVHYFCLSNYLCGVACLCICMSKMIQNIDDVF